MTDDLCNVTTGQCNCKTNTEGRDCSECVDGTFNLQASNPFGCQPCFCFGLTNSCSAATGYIQFEIQTIFNSDSIDPLGGWTISETTSSSGPTVVTTPLDGVIILFNSSGYLSAPAGYLGYKLPSYGQFLRIELNGTSLMTLSEYDVLMEGNGIEIGYSFEPLHVVPGTLNIHLHESNQWINTQLNRTATAHDIQQVLSSLSKLQLTTNYASNVTLYEVSLESVTEGTSPSPSVTWAEMCECPQNYTGLSCEQCANGFTRNAEGHCEICECNGFSSQCDPENGTCINCSDYTAGPSCNECISGAYGSPTQGIPCQLCPCPLTTTNGQFSDVCLNSTNGIVCLNCPVGHTGNQCEVCMPGYFGDPLGEHGAPTPCTDCLCNGNINSILPGSCNTTTGVCILCLNNTDGDNCEVCADGYYGDAITAKNCTGMNK